MRRVIATSVVTALLWVGAAGAQGGQGTPQAGQAPLTETFTLQPGGSATIQFEGFCYQYGEPFPEALQGPGGLAEGNIRALMTLARDQGLTGSGRDALEVQYAIWQLQGEAEAPAGGDLTRQLLNQTRAAPGPAAPQATSIIDAANSGQITVSVTEFAPVGSPVEIAPGVSDTFYGRGRMTVTNTSQAPLTLYMPTGTLLTSVDPEEQDLVAYTTSIDGGDAPAAGTPTATQAATQAAQIVTQAPTQTTSQIVTQAPTQTTSQIVTQAPTRAATQAPTQAPTQAATQPASPVASQPQRAQAYLEPTDASATQLPNTSGGGLPTLAIALGALGLGVHGVRKLLRRKG